MSEQTNNAPKILNKKITIESITEVPEYEVINKVVEVPEIEYIEVPYERTVEIYKYEEKEVKKVINIPKYVTFPNPVYKEELEYFKIDRKVPKPVILDTVTDVDVKVLNPKYKIVKYKVRLPRFIEVPVPAELLKETLNITTAQYSSLAKVSELSQSDPIDVCQLETLLRNFQTIDKDLALMYKKKAFENDIDNFLILNKTS